MAATITSAATPPNENCGVCVYYAADPNVAGQGWCRRYPPTPVYSFIYQTPTNLNPTMWPNIGADDWCGEFSKTTQLADSPP